MFSEEQIKQYRSITAPAKLRERVMETKTVKKKSSAVVMKYSSLAACLAVVIAITMIFGSMGGVSLYVDGQALDENGVAVYSAASAVSARGLFGIQIEAELRGKTEVTTSEGDVYIYDIETQEALEGKFEAERVMIIWDIIPEDISKTYVLTIENSRGATEVTLLFNETAGWTICSIEK